MLETLWLTFQEWVLSIGFAGILIIFVLSILHPTLEGPAALLLLTILTILVDSIWLASAMLLVGFSELKRCIIL
jgi:xanthosine utilization system XapX-like protein